MKKIVVLLILCACCGGALCAQGVGLGYNMYWAGTLYRGMHDGYYLNNPSERPLNNSTVNGQAVFLYVDGLFVEANVGVRFNSSYRETYTRLTKNMLFPNMEMTDLKLALFLKGPWIVYPLLGVEWISPLSAVYYNGHQTRPATGDLWERIKEQFNNLWLKAGIGLDIPLGKISLRPQFLAGYRINTAKEQEMLRTREPGKPEYKSIFGYSLEGRIALGIRF